MELYLSSFAVAFMVVLLVIFYLFAKVSHLGKKFDEIDSKIKGVNENTNYIKGIELDFSTLEEKMKDEMEQLENQANDNLTEIEKVIDEHEEEIKELKSKVEELEKAEEQMKDEIEAKIEEKLEDVDEKLEEWESEHKAKK